MADTAVIINEFGEIGLDHLLVESSNEDMLLLSSGCLCCTIRGDLIETLRGLYKRRGRGEIPPSAAWSSRRRAWPTPRPSSIR